MQLNLSAFNYRQRLIITEALYLFIMCVLVPFAIGHNIFDKYSFIFSLVLVNCLQIPAIVLFYSWLLPITAGRKKIWLLLLLLPIYLLVYELNSRLSALTVMHLPFVPLAYREALASAHPEVITWGAFIQNLGWTGLVLLAATSLYMMRRLIASQHNLYEADTARLKLELAQLRSQIQPHFFFNTLNNLYALSVSGSAKAPAMIASLSAIMRYVLYESETGKVPLGKEIAFIRSYIELEEIRHDEPGIIEFDVQGNISSILIEPLLFLPLIENAFKHALQTDIPRKYVKIAIVVNGNELLFQTSNPKPPDQLAGFDKKRSGIGLKNVRKRLQLLYPGKHQMEVDNNDSLFNVLLTLRLN